VKAISAANAILIAGGTLALWAFGRHLYVSGSIEPQTLTPSTAVRDAPIVWGVLATLFFAALGLRRTPRMAVAAVAVSLMAVAYAAEVVLATTALGPAANAPSWSIDRASPQKKREIALLAAESGGTIDTRDRIELLDDSRRRGIDMVPAVMLSQFMDLSSISGSGELIHADAVLPLGGISNTPTLLCNEEGQFVSYNSDEHGFRNPRGIWNSAHVDIAAVGQSFVQGYCVPDGSGFVDLLRTHSLAVLNLGVSGQSALLQLAAIKEYLPRYAPKIVLWFFAEGIDLGDLYSQWNHPLSRRYREPTFIQHLLSRQPEIDDALRRMVSGMETSERQAPPRVEGGSFVERSLAIARLWNLRQKAELAYGVGRDEPQLAFMLDEESRELRSVLEQARTVTQSWGGTIYFVYLPSWSRFRNEDGAADREHTTVVSLVHTLGIPVIDVQPVFQAQDDSLSLFPFRRFGHYNERGNQLVAKTILHALHDP